MKQVTTFTTATTASGVIYAAYGIQVEDNRTTKSSAFDFNEYDLWFGQDFDWIISNMMEHVFDEIKSDITSDWSTNLSEQLS